MDVNERARRQRAGRVLASIWMLGVLAACGGSGTNSKNTNAADSSTAAANQRATASSITAVGVTTSIAQPASTEGRLLASNCFQCHGTQGLGGFDNIRGSEASEVMEFMTKSASNDIMAAHAQGYTPAQLKKIIAYLQQ